MSIIILLVLLSFCSKILSSLLEINLCVPVQFFMNLLALNITISYFSCERGNARLSRVLLSYAPVLIIILASPIMFIITYNKGKRSLTVTLNYIYSIYCAFHSSLESTRLIVLSN